VAGNSPPNKSYFSHVSRALSRRISGGFFIALISGLPRHNSLCNLVIAGQGMRTY
jgi:hypothetical protein